MEYNEKQEIWLFENDLSEFRVSDEGNRVSMLIAYDDNDQLVRKKSVSADELRKAFANYWEARNVTGLHFSNLQRLEKAKEIDAYEALLYREQN